MLVMHWSGVSILNVRIDGTHEKQTGWQRLAIHAVIRERFTDEPQCVGCVHLINKHTNDSVRKGLYGIDRVLLNRIDAITPLGAVQTIMG